MITRFQIGELIPGFPVSSWNEIADRVDQQGLGFTPDDLGQFSIAPGAYLMVYTAVDVDQYGVLSLQPVFRDPNNAAHEYFKKQPPIFSAVSPIAGDHSPGVAIQPIPANNFGYVMVGGVTWCDVDITDADHTFCKVLAGNVTRMVSTDTDEGPHIMWKPSGTGIKTCAVALCLSGELPVAPGAPLDPPSAIATETTTTGETRLYDTTGSTAGAGATLTTIEWTISLNGPHVVQIYGTIGSPPSSVVDTRGILNASHLTGNIESFSFSWTTAQITNADLASAISVIVTQDDGQTDTATIPFWHAESGTLSLTGSDAGLQPSVWPVEAGNLALDGSDVQFNPWPVGSGDLPLTGTAATLAVSALLSADITASATIAANLSRAVRALGVMYTPYATLDAVLGRRIALNTKKTGDQVIRYQSGWIEYGNSIRTRRVYPVYSTLVVPTAGGGATTATANVTAQLDKVVGFSASFTADVDVSSANLQLSGGKTTASSTRLGLSATPRKDPAT